MQLIRTTFLLLISAVAAAAAEPNKRIITLEECIAMALQRNFDVQIQRLGPEISRFGLNVAYGPYEPTLNFFAGKSFSSQPGGFDEFGQPLPSTEIEGETFGSASSLVTGSLPSGLRYQAGLDVAHTVFNPPGFPAQSQHDGGGVISITQPLLRNMWIDGTRQLILVGKQNLKFSELMLRLQFHTTITLVEQAYYDLIFARENVKVQETALQLAERLLAENKKRVEVGAMAPLDEKQAEAQVFARRADLLSALRALDAQLNLLKNLITDDYAGIHTTAFDPAGKLTAVPVSLQLSDSWSKGLTMRPDLEQLRVDLERKNIALKYNYNQLFPSLDVVASYGRNALNTSYGAVLEDIGAGDTPRYSVGLNLSIPLGNRAARNNYRASKAEKQQAILSLKKLEQNIMVEIDNAVGQAKTSFERVEATRQARLFAEAALDAEQKKLENGKSTSFIVLQLQQDLTAARSAEIRALADYNIALALLAQAEGSTLERHKLDLEVK